MENHIAKLLIFIVVFFTIKALLKVNRTNSCLQKTAAKFKTTTSKLNQTTVSCESPEDENMEYYEKQCSLSKEKLKAF